jgi:hypothetical protein
MKVARFECLCGGLLNSQLYAALYAVAVAMEDRPVDRDRVRNR